MLSDDLRSAMRSSGLTSYALAKQASSQAGKPVEPKSVKEFMEGGRSNLALSTADCLAESLGLGLAPRGQLAQAAPTPDYDAEVQRRVRQVFQRLSHDAVGECLKGSTDRLYQILLLLMDDRSAKDYDDDPKHFGEGL